MYDLAENTVYLSEHELEKLESVSLEVFSDILYDEEESKISLD